MCDDIKILAEKMIIDLDVLTDGCFDLERDHDLFVTAFVDALKEYSLVPTAAILNIEKK